MKEYFSNLKDSYLFVYGREKGSAKYKHQNITKILSVIVVLILTVLSVTVMQNPVKYSTFAGIVFTLLAIIVPDVLLGNKVKKRRDSIKLGLADFMDRTAVLLEAGLPLWKAIAETAVRQEISDSFTDEITIAVKSYSGKEGYITAPEEALLDMAERCSTVMVSSFVSTVIQNSRKGSEELVYIFKNQAASYRTERRNIAKKRAEEASALMLLPTAMVFLAVIALVTTPAVLTVVSGVFG